MKYHRAKIVLLGGLSDDSTQEDVEKCLHKLYVTLDYFSDLMKNFPLNM